MATDIHPEQEPRLTEIISGIVNDAQELVKQQLALFKTEVKDDIHKTKEAALPLVCGVLVGGLGVIFLAFTVVYLLAWAFPAWPLWCCYGLVGLLLTGGGFALYWVGKTRFESFNPLPEKSADALKENVQWLMNPK